MPRPIPTFFRLVKLIFLSWLCLIGLWTFLPSPRIFSPDGNGKDNYARNEYIQQTLTSGRVLRTMHTWTPSFTLSSVPAVDPFYEPNEVAHTQHPADDCRGLLFDWRLVSDAHHKAAVLLEMGRDFRVRINLTDDLLRVQENSAPADGVNVVAEGGNDKSVYISQLINLQVDAGSRDHVINMPWFHFPDAALFHNQMHGFTYDVQIRVVARRETGTVEIWKAASLLDCARRQEHEQQQHRYGGIRKNDPFTLDFDKTTLDDRENGILASFSNIYHISGNNDGENQPPRKGKAMSDIKITISADDLPSKTYKLRSLILVPLAPSLIIAFFLLSEVLTPLFFPVLLPGLLGFIMIVLICWAYYRYSSSRRNRTTAAVHWEHAQMGFGDWCSRFWMTRPFYPLLFWWCCWSSNSRRKGQRDRYSYNTYHRHWAGENSERRKRKVVIWGPAGPVYEE